MARSERERLLRWARREHPTFRASDAAEKGFHSQALTRLVQEGAVERVSTGVYRIADAEVTEHHGLALAAAAVPGGVVCLISALEFHGIGTQLGYRIWLALERGSRTPRVSYPPVEIVRFSGQAFRAGIETHEIEGHAVEVYNLPKTIADCFKFRNKIGLDVAIEALREAWIERRLRPVDIEPYAKICRVNNVMRPYLEALAG